jgi:hypothetical protein
MEQNPGNCLNCGTPLKGIYCQNCGEKVLDEKDKSVRHLLGQFIDGITHVDGKILKTIRLLVFRPGFLTVEYMQGRRKRYMKPIQLFIVMNLAYFLLTNINTFYTPLESYNRNYGFADKMIEDRLEKRKVSFEDYAEAHNHKAKSLAKLMIIINIPLFALGLYLLHFRAKKYFTEFLTFTLHYYSFMIFTFLIVFPYVLILVMKIWQPGTFLIGDKMMMPPLLLFSTIYLTFALRKVFHQKLWLVIPKAVLLTFSLFPVIVLYRMLLFLLTFYTS